MSIHNNKEIYENSKKHEDVLKNIKITTVDQKTMELVLKNISEINSNCYISFIKNKSNYFPYFISKKYDSLDYDLEEEKDIEENDNVKKIEEYINKLEKLEKNSVNSIKIKNYTQKFFLQNIDHFIGDKDENINNFISLKKLIRFCGFSKDQHITFENTELRKKLSDKHFTFEKTELGKKLDENYSNLTENNQCKISEELEKAKKLEESDEEIKLSKIEKRNAKPYPKKIIDDNIDLLKYLINNIIPKVDKKGSFFNESEEYKTHIYVNISTGKFEYYTCPNVVLRLNSINFEDYKESHYDAINNAINLAILKMINSREGSRWCSNFKFLKIEEEKNSIKKMELMIEALNNAMKE